MVTSPALLGGLLHLRRDGHDLLYDPIQASATGQITELECNYPPTGVVANLKHLQTDVVFESGDLFVLLTDGYLEVENKASEQIGQPRIETLIKSNVGRPLNDIFDTVLKAVRDHGPQDDDQTLLLVRVS